MILSKVIHEERFHEKMCNVYTDICEKSLCIILIGQPLPPQKQIFPVFYYEDYSVHVATPEMKDTIKKLGVVIKEHFSIRSESQQHISKKEHTD